MLEWLYDDELSDMLCDALRLLRERSRTIDGQDLPAMQLIAEYKRRHGKQKGATE